jgi:hypothetical protein
MKRNSKFDISALSVSLLLALAFRLPGLTVFLTADEARSWFGRSIIFLDALLRADWANTAPGSEAGFIENVSLSPAPGVTTMWSGALGILLEYLRQGASGSPAEFLRHMPFDPLDPAMLVSLRLPGALIAATVVGLTYWWSRPLWGRWGALLAAGFIALDPFYLALSRVLGHDALVSGFMWLSLLAFLRSQVTGNRRPFLLASGAVGGLAFLSKYPALFMGAFIGAAMLILYLRQGDGLLSALKLWLTDMTLWTVAAAVTVFVAWPAMWVNPVNPIGIILNDALRAAGGSHDKGSYFMGQILADPGPLFYPLVMMLRTTPIIFLGVLVWLWQTVRQRRTTSSAVTLLAYVLLYGLLVTVGGKKQDRYILPAFPALMALAGLGWLYIGRFPFLAARGKWILPTAALVIQIMMIYPFAPYYFSYYNPFAGGGRVTDTMLVGWGEGLNEAADWLNAQPDVDSLKATAWYSTAFEPYFQGRAIYKVEDEKISRSAKPGLAADYVVFYVNQIQRQLPSPGALQYFRAKPPAHTVTLNGIDYAWVYASAGMQHVIPNDARLVGQAELLGYNLTRESGEPLGADAVYPESVALLSLFWEWQGKAPEEPLGLSLIDAQGQTRAWGNAIETNAPLPFDQWQPGMVARDEFALVIFPDTPPGDYRLSVWISRPTTGETVGVFPLDETISVISHP